MKNDHCDHAKISLVDALDLVPGFIVRVRSILAGLPARRNVTSRSAQWYFILVITPPSDTAAFATIFLGEAFKMVRYTSLIVLVAAVLAACSNAGPVSQPVDKGLTTTDPIVIEATQQALRVTNNSARAIFYWVIERESAERYLPPPPDPAVYAHVDPAAVKTIPYTDIQGYGPDAAEVVFTWGHLVPASAGGFYFDSLRAMLIKL
jgi:hypothetical protein